MIISNYIYKRTMLFIVSLFLASIAFAEDVSFKATVNTNQITLNEALQLTLTVSGYKDNLDPIDLPVIDGFQAQYAGPSTSVSIVNGHYHSERSFRYHLIPNKAGHFQIPVITATIGGQVLSSVPIEVDVSDAPPQQALVNNPDSATPQALKDKVILKMSVPSDNVILNEQVPLTIRLYVSDIPMRDIQMPQLEANGFTVGAFEKPTQTQEVLNGINYEVVVFKVIIYPTRLGPLNIAPAKLGGNLLFNKPRDNAFGDDFFNSLFSSYVARPVTVSSNNLNLQVEALPEGAPEGFNGAVGQFDFMVTVNPTEVKEGDPLTLRMRITGDGNLKNLRFPQVNDAGLKTYDPTIKDLEQGKELEQVIIPTDDKITSIGPFHFIYFDTSAKSYKVITQGPFAIKVNKPKDGEGFKVVGFHEFDTKVGVAPVTMQEGFFKEAWQKGVAGAVSLLKNIWFWISVVLLGLVFLSFQLWQGYQRRMNTDHAFARRTKAYKEALAGVKLAKEFLQKGSAKDFYAALQRTLNNYFADKLHKGFGAVTVGDIEGLLRSKGVDAASIKMLLDLFTFCEDVRFAGGAANASRMQDDLAHLQALLNIIEKKLK